jgi:hypothetical protein
VTEKLIVGLLALILLAGCQTQDACKDSMCSWYCANDLGPQPACVLTPASQAILENTAVSVGTRVQDSCDCASC